MLGMAGILQDCGILCQKKRKKKQPFFTEQCFNTSVVYNMEVLEHFFAQKCMHEDLI